MTPTRSEETSSQEVSQPDISKMDVDPAFLKFVARYLKTSLFERCFYYIFSFRCGSGRITGIDAICVAFLHAFKEVCFFIFSFLCFENYIKNYRQFVHI